MLDFMTGLLLVLGIVLILVWVTWYPFSRLVKKKRLTGLSKFLGWIGLLVFILGAVMSAHTEDDNSSNKEASVSSKKASTTSKKTSATSKKTSAKSNNEYSKSAKKKVKKLTEKQMTQKINDTLEKGLQSEQTYDAEGWSQYVGKLQYLTAEQGLNGVNIYLNDAGMDLSKAEGYEVAKQAKTAVDGFLVTMDVTNSEQKNIFEYLHMDLNNGKAKTQAYLVTKDGDEIAGTSPLNNDQFKEKDFIK